MTKEIELKEAKRKKILFSKNNLKKYRTTTGNYGGHLTYKIEVFQKSFIYFTQWVTFVEFLADDRILPLLENEEQELIKNGFTKY